MLPRRKPARSGLSEVPQIRCTALLAFERRYGLNMKAEAAKLWQASRHRLKHQRNQEK